MVKNKKTIYTVLGLGLATLGGLYLAGDKAVQIFVNEKLLPVDSTESNNTGIITNPSPSVIQAKEEISSKVQQFMKIDIDQTLNAPANYWLLHTEGYLPDGNHYIEYVINEKTELLKLTINNGVIVSISNPLSVWEKIKLGAMLFVPIIKV